MAPVSRDRSRAQLLLIGGLALAVSLVAIALVLNSAIYTHNLASRADSPGQDTEPFTREVRLGAGGMLDYANRNYDVYGAPGTDDTVVGEYVRGLDYIADEVSFVASTSGRLVSVAHVGGSTVEGVRVVDNVSGGSTFYPATGTPDQWNVTDEVRVRSYRMTVLGGLESQSDSTTDGQIGGDLLNSGSAFVVTFTGDVTRHVAVYDDGQPTVRVYDDSATVLETCRVASIPLRIDFAAGTVNGEACQPLAFADDLGGPSSIEYTYGGNVEGTYSLVADVPIVDHTGEMGPFTDVVDTANYDGQCGGPTYNDADGAYPRVEPAIYASDLAITYQTDSVTYRSVQRVANDEPGPAVQAPRVTSFDVSETDADAADGEFDVTWTATDPNGDSVDTTIRVTEPDGDVKLIDDPGSSTASVDVDDESGDYTIELVVDDGPDDSTIDGNSRAVVERHDDDGDESDCPP